MANTPSSVKDIIAVDSSAAGDPGVGEPCPAVFMVHSIMDDLRIQVYLPGSDIHPNFTLPVIPVWKTVRGMTFSMMKRDCLDILDGTRPEVIILQLAGNDVDSTVPVRAIAKDYVHYTHFFTDTVTPKWWSFVSTYPGRRLDMCQQMTTTSAGSTSRKLCQRS